MRRFVVQPAPWDPPELPSPFCGSFELWMEAGGNEGLVVLNLWCDVPSRIIAPYVRNFVGESPDDCIEAFGAWLSAQACGRPCSRN
jgi:hypothetical protein